MNTTRPTSMPVIIHLNPPKINRPGVVLMRTVREGSAGILVWGVGLSSLIVIAAVIYPILRENNVILNLLAGFGILDRFAGNYGLDAATLVSFRGFLALQFLDWTPLLLSVYAIPKTLSLVLDEEKRGTLDILLSTPLPRWQLLTEKFLALLLSLILIVFMMWGTLLACGAIFASATVTPTEATLAIWHILPISSAIAAVGLFTSVLFREARTAAGVAGAFVLASYFVRSMADTTQAEFLLELKRFSIFNYFSIITMFSYGAQPQWDAVLLAVTLVFFLMALLVFHRRDLQP